MEMGQWKKWLALFAFCTFIGLLSSTTFLAENLLEGDRTPYRFFLVNELTGSYGVFVLLPLLFPFIRRFPVKRETWFWVVPVHLLASVVFGGCHTLIMIGSRMVLYPVMQLGSFRVGDSLLRFWMEYQKQLLIYAGIVALVHFVWIYLEKQEEAKRVADLELRAAHLQSSLAESRLDALQGQLQPHFLFNTLNMISSLMYDDVASADRMISRLSRLLRQSLDQAAHQKIPLSQEIEFVEAYLDIMSCRFQNRLVYHLDIVPEAADFLVPVFLLQPLVENSVKHGSLGDVERLSIEISARSTGDSLEIEIEDNGPGFSGNLDSAMERGLGLRNTVERLRNLYGDAVTINFDTSARRGLTVRVSLPVEAPEPEGERVSS
jgi:signal transduction histidine kinase